MEALHAECVSICREERRQRDALYAELAATRQQLSEAERLLENEAAAHARLAETRSDRVSVKPVKPGLARTKFLSAAIDHSPLVTQRLLVPDAAPSRVHRYQYRFSLVIHPLAQQFKSLPDLLFGSVSCCGPPRSFLVNTITQRLNVPDGAP
jgi:hypothetical protein